LVIKTIRLRVSLDMLTADGFGLLDQPKQDISFKPLRQSILLFKQPIKPLFPKPRYVGTLRDGEVDHIATYEQNGSPRFFDLVRYHPVGKPDEVRTAADYRRAWEEASNGLE